MEKDLKKSVEQLQVIETKLNDIVSSLNQQHNLISEQSTLFASNIEKLTEQVNVFERDTNTLTKTHLSIMEMVPEIVSSLKQTITEIQATSDNLINQSNQLNSINNNLANTNLEIEITSNQLKKVAGLFNTETEQLSTLINSVKQLHAVCEKITPEVNDISYVKAPDLATQNLLSVQQELGNHMQEKEQRRKRHQELLYRTSQSLKYSQNIDSGSTPISRL